MRQWKHWVRTGLRSGACPRAPRQKGYYRCLLVRHQLATKGLETLSCTAPEMYYKAILVSKEPAKIADNEKVKIYRAMLLDMGEDIDVEMPALSAASGDIPRSLLDEQGVVPKDESSEEVPGPAAPGEEGPGDAWPDDDDLRDSEAEDSEVVEPFIAAPESKALPGWVSAIIAGLPDTIEGQPIQVQTGPP